MVEKITFSLALPRLNALRLGCTAPHASRERRGLVFPGAVPEGSTLFAAASP